MSENVLLYKTTFAECIIMHSLISLNFVPWVGSATNDLSDSWFVVSLFFMKPSLTFQYLFVSFRSFFFHLGYHVSSSMVVEEARWESRHLLQEDNHSKLYSEPEKNCTEPGESNLKVSHLQVSVWEFSEKLLLEQADVKWCLLL